MKRIIYDDTKIIMVQNWIDETKVPKISNMKFLDIEENEKENILNIRVENQELKYDIKEPLKTSDEQIEELEMLLLESEGLI